jgi:D-amino-acid dehydrogenase
VRLNRLEHYGRQRLRAVCEATRLDYERSEGCLLLLRSTQDLELAAVHLRSLEASRTAHAVVDAAHCRRLEPGLNRDTPLHGGIYLPDTDVGNCRQFAYLLRAEAQRLGAQFRFHSRVVELQAGTPATLVHVHEPPAESTVVTPNDNPASDGPLTQPLPFEPLQESFDAIVVCAGVDARALLRPLGVRVPIAPVYGYSVTAPMRHFEAHPDVGPRSAVIDMQHGACVTRIGQRLRVAGGAELGGNPMVTDRRIVERLYQVLHDWFPGVAHLAQAQRWKGASPMLPDGPPVLGASGAPGVWLNAGHGAHGWALGSASARVLADLLGGRSPAVDIEGLGVERWR